MRKESSIIHIMQLCPLVVLSSIGKDIRGSRIGGSLESSNQTKNAARFAFLTCRRTASGQTLILAFTQ